MIGGDDLVDVEGIIRLVPNLTRRSSFNRARRTCSEGGC